MDTSLETDFLFFIKYQYPEYIDVNISAGTSNTPSKFSWAKSKGANNYYLRIWDSTGTKEVVSVWGTDGKLSWELQLEAGDYNAQVCAVNGDYVTNSAFKAFTVTYDPYPAYINVNVSAGTSNTPSKFSWAKSKGANNYYLRIWDSTGTKEVVSVWGTDGKLSWELQLEAGDYNAQVCAVNGDYVTNSGLNKFTVNIASSTKLYFNCNGGNCSIPWKTVKYNQKYGDLPTPTKTGFAFEYWHTADGTLISKDSINLATTDETLYAYWEKINVKGDINDDGKADVADLVMLQKWLIGSGKLTNWKNADLCEDGVIDAFDMAALRRLLLN